MSIDIVVVDDNDLLRAGLVAVLTSDPELRVVAEANSGASGLERAIAARPDLVLMDIEMPGGDGITATRRLVEELPDVRVMILTMFDIDDYVVEALRAGASGFLVKTTEPRALVAAVKACASGELTMGPSVMARLIESYTANPAEPPPPGLADLTPREAEVLHAMAQGLSNSEIGAELYLAETTVKTHVARVLAKLGVRDRVQAVVIAHRSGAAGF